MVFIFPMFFALCISGLGKGIFRSFLHFSIGLLVSFCCWVVSVVGLFILEGWPDLGIGIWIQCLHIVRGRCINSDILESSPDNRCSWCLTRSHETPSFSLHVSLFSSFYAPDMET